MFRVRLSYTRKGLDFYLSVLICACMVTPLLIALSGLTALAQTRIPVIVTVLKPNSGGANAGWTESYFRRLLDRAESYLDSRDGTSGKKIAFDLLRLDFYRNSNYYEMTTLQVVRNFCKHSLNGTISIVIANPYVFRTEGGIQVWGRSSGRGAGQANPCLVMRTTGRGDDHHARVFLHETGHELGLQHTGRPYTTDNYWRASGGIQLLSNFGDHLSQWLSFPICRYFPEYSRCPKSPEEPLPEEENSGGNDDGDE